MKVLIAIDEQSCVTEAAAFVRNHYWTPGTQFVLINVVSPIMVDYPMASYPLFLESVSDEVQKAAEKLVEEAKLRIDGQPVYDVQTDVRIGMPVQVIVDAAKELQADMIIVGSHGRHGLSKFLLGSVSQEIAAHAPCSVVILRMTPADEEVRQTAPVAGMRVAPAV